MIKLVFLISFLGGSLPCMKYIPDRDHTDGIWDDKNVKRKLSDCECGLGINPAYHDKPWNVFIHTEVDPTNTKICTGTIIASNLIVTSHKCLTLQGKTTAPYDIFKPTGASSNMVPLSGISVFEDMYQQGYQFNITEVILNAHYAASARTPLPVNDVAIIKVKEDFTIHATLRPICVPIYDEGMNLRFQPMTYYGANDYERSYPYMEIRDSIKGLEVGESCGRQRILSRTSESSSTQKILCLRYDPSLRCTAPKVEGGPLVLTSKDGGGNDRTFLVGVASKLSSDTRPIEDKFVYFSNAVLMSKYFEDQAHRLDSTWCRTPKLNLNPSLDKAPPLKESLCGPWPEWENLEPVVRDESLNCDCGNINKAYSGRIAGGETAKPYEFGWMTLLEIYPDGRDQGRSLCGGSIINDRIVITAGHCVIMEEAVPDRQENFAVAPDLIDVIVNVHSRTGDANSYKVKVKAVHYHPGYVAGERQGFNDHDIALLELKKPLEFKATGVNGVRPVCIPKMGINIPIIGKDATVAGWGLTDPSNFSSAAAELQKLQVPIQPFNYCKKYPTVGITDRFLCAGTLDENKDSGRGDSGGPLALEVNGKWTQVGVVSFGIDVWDDAASEWKIAGLYADLQQYINFADYHSQRAGAKWCKS